ncbi:MAG: gliding motility-associated ABC transporter ATP-binding subunit GldA [Cytophagales bacterium]|nr:gliding motility-associated ABC transporter ATP-binding subunit GldA [Cytophagales bacterium]
MVIVDNLVKQYGQQLAVDHISFEALPGQITGFLGPNGAGKSTTMKIATGFLQATEGDVVIKGKKVRENPYYAKQVIGYLPEHNPLYLQMYVREYLSFIANAYRLSSVKKRIEEVIDLVGLQREKHKKLKALSKGYRQRVGLAQALLPDPEVLILDEPTTGLDPNQLVEIRKVIKEASQDKTLIFSTHIMQEVEAICDRVVIINQGKIVADDTLQNLKSQAVNANVYTVSFESAIDKEILGSLTGVQKVEEKSDHSYLVYSEDDQLKKAILKLAAEKDLPLISVHTSGGSLEEIFQKLTGNT